MRSLPGPTLRGAPTGRKLTERESSAGPIKYPALRSTAVIPVVVDDLPAAIHFFTTLGMALEGYSRLTFIYPLPGVTATAARRSMSKVSRGMTIAFAPKSTSSKVGSPPYPC